MKALKWVGRTLFLDPFAVRLCLIVMLTFTAVPTIQAFLGGYVKLLLAWGGAVLLCDLFTKRRALRNRYAGFLALFVLCYGVSIWLNRAAGLAGNVSELCYIVLFFFVLFAYDPDGSTERVAFEVRTLARVFIVLTAVLSLLSLTTFFFSFNYNYSQDVTADYSENVFFGVQDNRLYGLYNPNTGSMLNLLSSMFSLLLLALGVRVGERVAQIANLLLQYVCLALTVSRTAWYMYAVFVVLFALFVMPLSQKAETARKPLVRTGVRAGAAVVGVAVILFLSTPLRGLLADAPERLGWTVPESVIGSLSERVELYKNGESAEGDAPADSNAAHGNTTSLITQRGERTDDGGILTGRQYLWKGGIRAFLDHPLFGTTHKGVFEAVKPYVPAEWQQFVQGGGLHNMFFMVLACSGGTGTVVLVGFLVTSGVRALKWMWRRRGERAAVLTNGLTVMLITVLGTEMLESRLLYVVTIFGALFWTLYGYAMRLVDACEPERAAESGVYNRLMEKRRRG